MLWKVYLKERTATGQTIRESIGFVRTTGDNDPPKYAWNAAIDKYFPLEPNAVQPIKRKA